MDIRQYIESGILEQYVLGMLGEKQHAEVRNMAIEYPEVQKEIEAIEAALGTYSEAYAKAPPEAVKGRVLQAIDDGANGSISNFFKFTLLVASWLILLGLIWYVYSQKLEAENENERIGLQLATVESQLQQLTVDCQEISRRYAALTAPGNRAITLSGTTLSPNSKALVFYNAEAGNSYLSRIELPIAPQGSQYQLWAIVDGQPVDMGVLPLEAEIDAFIDIPFVENASAFAVTLEQEGGSPAPSLDKMFVLGQI